MENFNLPPIRDPITRSGEPMSDVMQMWLGEFIQNLLSYLTSSGIFIPNVTSTDRDGVISPQNGMIIYNTTIGAPQIYQSGAWKTFTTV